VQCSCTSMAQCMRHAPLDVFTPSCLDMHGEYILTHYYYYPFGNLVLVICAFFSLPYALPH
jgi:hypothetical protein